MYINLDDANHIKMSDFGVMESEDIRSYILD